MWWYHELDNTIFLCYLNIFQNSQICFKAKIPRSHGVAVNVDEDEEEDEEEDVETPLN